MKRNYPFHTLLIRDYQSSLVATEHQLRSIKGLGQNGQRNKSSSKRAGIKISSNLRDKGALRTKSNAAGKSLQQVAVSVFT